MQMKFCFACVRVWRNANKNQDDDLMESRGIKNSIWNMYVQGRLAKRIYCDVESIHGNEKRIWLLLQAHGVNFLFK